MKRILFTMGVVPTGAERVSRTIARLLDRAEYEPCFATVEPGVDVDGILSDFLPDVVFCSQIHLAKLIADSVSLHPEIKLVFRCNYMLQDLDAKVVAEASEAYQKADLVIAQTEEMRNQLTDTFSLSAESVMVLRNPVDTEMVSELAGTTTPYPDDGKKHFLWVGRFDPIKDLPTLLDAFGIMHSSNPDTVLYLVGDCPNSGLYQHDGVVLKGFQQNPFPWIKFADCLVLCSKSEALPNVVLEALSLGVPVVCTRCCKDIEDEILMHGGKLVDVGDPSGLAGAMFQSVFGGCIPGHSNEK